MDTTTIDKATLKLVLKEVLREDIGMFKALIKEILVENQIITSEAQDQRSKKIAQLLEEDFDKYSEVFKALA